MRLWYPLPWLFSHAITSVSRRIRRLKAAGYVEQRTGKGSHRQFVHSATGKVITVSVHTRKEVGTGLAHRILKEAGL